MFLDNSLAFASLTTGQEVTATAASTNVVDLTGAGSGNAPAMINGFPETNTSIGFDIGGGDGVAIPYLYLGVSAKGTNSGTITIALQAAPDDGSYSPGTYTTIYTTTAITANNLVVGDYLVVPVPPTLFDFPSEALPRFYRLNYTVSGTVDLTFISSLLMNPAESLLGTKYNNNFVAV